MQQQNHQQQERQLLDRPLMVWEAAQRALRQRQQQQQNQQQKYIKLKFQVCESFLNLIKKDMKNNNVEAAEAKFKMMNKCTQE